MLDLARQLRELCLSKLKQRALQRTARREACVRAL
jgi:hypothetical protein